MKGVYSAQLEILVTYYHLTFDQIGHLTPLQREWLLRIYAKQNPRMRRKH